MADINTASLATMPAATVDDVPLASTSAAPAAASRHGLCALCSSAQAKYTCPRCETRTCSLGCTVTHKEQDGCTGLRDRVSYVGMNAYGDLGMWRDLGYLREVREKVADWGKNSVQPGAASQRERERAGYGGAPAGKGKERERERERDGGRGGRRDERQLHPQQQQQQVSDRLANLSQRELKLKRQLGFKGVEILFMPRESERHTSNQSNYNLKKRKLHLTVSMSVFDTKKQKTHSATLHHNPLTATLAELLSSTLAQSASKAADSTSVMDCSAYTMVLPCPMRPTTYIPRNAVPIVPAAITRLEAEKRRVKAEADAKKPLPAAPSSLPSRPSWLPAVEGVELPYAIEEVVQDDVGRPEEQSGAGASAMNAYAAVLSNTARRVWKIGSVTMDTGVTVEDALRGTSILEWPEFELWPTEVVQRELKQGTLELAERRQAYERNRGQKRPAEGSLEQGNGSAYRAEADEGMEGEGEDDDILEEDDPAGDAQQDLVPGTVESVPDSDTSAPSSSDVSSDSEEEDEEEDIDGQPLVA